MTSTLNLAYPSIREKTPKGKETYSIMAVEETKGKPRGRRRTERESEKRGRNPNNDEKKASYTSIKNWRKVLTQRTITRRTHKKTLGEEPERGAIKGKI
ncbi:hypothetical protein E3N88_24166 [Mikania micrantha]|uniref:Uncharacterized protein n=1 Tax=Mikania micrantha TaxID=192012 RepID=A0A5N6NHV0_9ASTR|nr:hypothetical protein E3N88_24166 [Mikania micrantha]